MWQHKYYLPLAVTMNIGVPLLLGWWYQDIIGMLLVIGAVRLVLNHHTTFFINSLAHIWGKQTYTDKNTARDNGGLAFFTFGEGYHNYHHTFENDYRNGIQWWHYDPTKWLIKACSWLGLAKKLRVAPAIKIETARAEMRLKYAQAKLCHQHQRIFIHLQQEFDSFVEILHDYYDLKKQLLESKANSTIQNYERSQLKTRYQQVKIRLQEQKQRWYQLTKQYAY